MISQSDLQKKLVAYSKTKVGKEKMAKRVEDAVSGVNPLASKQANGAFVSLKDMTKMANHLAAMIRSRLPDSITKVGDTLVCSSPRKRADGRYEIVLSFSAEALYRASLETSYYNPSCIGVYNIVALFNNGYRANTSIYGTWNSTRFGVIGKVGSVPEREPLHFMQDAQDEFNNIYGKTHNVFLELAQVYKES